MGARAFAPRSWRRRTGATRERGQRRPQGVPRTVTDAWPERLSGRRTGQPGIAERRSVALARAERKPRRGRNIAVSRKSVSRMPGPGSSRVRHLRPYRRCLPRAGRHGGKYAREGMDVRGQRGRAHGGGGGAPRHRCAARGAECARATLAELAGGEALHEGRLSARAVHGRCRGEHLVVGVLARLPPAGVAIRRREDMEALVLVESSLKGMSAPVLPSTDPVLPGAPEPRPPRELDRSLVTGVAWTAGVKWSVQLVVWISTLVVIRLLSPIDYGTMGMAGLFLGLIQMVSEFGVGTAVVTLHRLKADHLAQLNGLALLFGIGGCFVVAAAALPLGWFFATPALPAVIATLGTGFIISAFGVVPSALLTRDMKFRRVALFGGAQALVAAIATLALAALGFAYWSLVFGNLLGAGLFLALVMRARPVGFSRPRRSSLGDALNLSTNVIVGRVSWYIYSNADRSEERRVGKESRTR